MGCSNGSVLVLVVSFLGAECWNLQESPARQPAKARVRMKEPWSEIQETE